jgi:hypothetical protein
MLKALLDQSLKPGRFKLVVAGVEPLAFEFDAMSINFFSELETSKSVFRDADNIVRVNTDERNADSMYLVPVKIDDDFRNNKNGIARMLLKRVSSECAINGFATLSKMALALRKAVIARYSLEAWTKNPFVRMLSFYLSTINHDSDPFLENSTGIITTPKFDPITKTMSKEEKDAYLLLNAPIYGDTMVSIRCLLLVNSAFFYFSQVMPSSELDAMVQVVQFMFKSPYVNGDKLKSMISILKQRCFGLSPRSPVNQGFEYVFEQQKSANPSPLSFTVGKYPNASHNFFNAISEEYFSSLTTVRKLMPLVAERYEFLLRTPITQSSLEIYKWWMLPETVVGFIDNSIIHTAIAQYSNAPILEEKAPVYDAVRDQYAKIYAEGLSGRNVPRSFDEMVNTISRYAITTSSGLGRIKLSIRDPGSNRMIDVGIGNKLAALLGKGSEIFEREFVDKLMTESSPAKAGSRKTVARKKRVIGNTPFPLIAAESSVAGIKDAFANATEEFGTTGSTSNPFNDFRKFIQYIPFTIAYFCRDADSWDASLQMYNNRMAQVEAIMSIPDEAWPHFDFLGFKSLKEMILLVMRKYHDVWLEVRDMSFAPSKLEDGSKRKLPLRSKMVMHLFVVMLSGALGTFFDNSVTNLEISRSLFTSMAEAGVAISSAFRVLFSSVTGDDAADIFSILGDPPPELISEILSYNTEYMKKNGFVTKDIKTDFSPTLNYLKKVWVGNCYVPRPSIQPYSKENKNISLSKIETMSSRWGLFNAIIARGADIQFMHLLILSEWNSVRYLDNSNFGKTLGSDNYVDFFSIFLPPSYGGAGVPFFPSVGYGLLSNDLLSFMNPEFRSRLTRVKSILSPAIEKRRLIQAISREPDVRAKFADGISFAAKGVKPHRKATASFLLDHFSKELSDFSFNGLSILDYDKLLLNSVSEAIGNSIPRRFHIRMLKDAILKNSKTDVFLKDTGIYAKFRYVYTNEIVEPRYSHIPIAGLDPKLYHLYRICGISDRDFSNISSIERAIRGLIQHGLPRQISAEALVSTLTQGSYMTNPQMQAVALTIMGVDFPHASAFIAQYSSALPNYSISSSKHGISLGSESLSGMYLGDALLPFISEIDVTLSDSEKKFLFPAVIYMFIQGYFYFNSARKVRVEQISKTKTAAYSKEIHMLNKKPDMSIVDLVVQSFYDSMSPEEKKSLDL